MAFLSPNFQPRLAGLCLAGGWWRCRGGAGRGLSPDTVTLEGSGLWWVLVPSPSPSCLPGSQIISARGGGCSTGGCCPPPVPPGPELHKSAAGAGPNLLAVSPDLASICERWSARAPLHLFLPPRLNQRLGRLLAALSGITGGAPGSSLLLASARGAEITRQQHQLTATPCACFTEQRGTRGSPKSCPSLLGVLSLSPARVPPLFSSPFLSSPPSGVTDVERSSDCR